MTYDERLFEYLQASRKPCPCPGHGGQGDAINGDTTTVADQVLAKLVPDTVSDATVAAIVDPIETSLAATLAAGRAARG